MHSNRKSTGVKPWIPPHGGIDAQLELVEPALQSENLEEVERIRILLRRTNLAVLEKGRNFDEHLRGLDGSVKKNTSFVKRLRALNEGSRDSLLSDCDTINPSKYLPEIVTSIIEASFKTSDVPILVRICCILHQRHEAFASLLEAELPTKMREIWEEETIDAMKCRAKLRFVTELVAVDIIPAEKILIPLLSSMLASDMRNNSHIFLQVTVSFIKYYNTVLGLSSAEMNPSIELITIPQHARIREILTQYYDLIVAQVNSLHAVCLKGAARQKRNIAARGIASLASMEDLERREAERDSLWQSSIGIANLLQLKPIDLQMESDNSNENAGFVVADLSVKGAEYNEAAIFEAEDVRAFYEDVPDYTPQVPSILLDDAGAGGRKPRPENQENPETPEDEAAPALVAEDGQIEESEAPDAPARDVPGESSTKTKETAAGRTFSPFELLLQKLPTMYSRNGCDSLALEYLYLNSRSNRKRLLQELFQLTRKQALTIPYLCRFATVVSHSIPEFGVNLSELATGEFYGLSKSKERNMEFRIRNARLIAELVKFGLFPSQSVFRILRMLLDDFRWGHVEIFCQILEDCGRFLIRSPKTSEQMNVLLDIMIRIRNARSFEPRLNALMENTICICRPPEQVASQEEDMLEPWQQFIHHLLYKELCTKSAGPILTSLRKFKLRDEKYFTFLLESALNCSRLAYDRTPQVAAVVNGLSKVHENFGICYVDALCELIRRGMEDSSPHRLQEQIMQVKLLTDCQKLNLCSIEVVFDVLYSLITLGHLNDAASTLCVDKTGDSFRIRLVCTMLENAFPRSNPTTAASLKHFLQYLDLYILQKEPNSEIDFMVASCEERLAWLPWHRATGLEEAVQSLRVGEAVEEKVAKTTMEGEEVEEELQVPPALVEGNGSLSGGDDSLSEEDTHEQEQEQEQEHDTSESESEDVDDDVDDEEEEMEEDEEDEEDEEEEDEEEESSSASDSDSDSAEDLLYGSDEEETPHNTEEDELDLLFFRSIRESQESRKHEAGIPVFDAAIPVLQTHPSTHEQGLEREKEKEKEREHEKESTSTSTSANASAKETRQVRLLVKKGAKAQFRTMQVDDASSLGTVARRTDLAQDAERAVLRQHILGYEKNQASWGEDAELELGEGPVNSRPQVPPPHRNVNVGERGGRMAQWPGSVTTRRGRYQFRPRATAGSHRLTADHLAQFGGKRQAPA